MGFILFKFIYIFATFLVIPTNFTQERTEEKKKIFELAGGKRNKHNKQQQQRTEPPEPVRIGAQSEDDDGGGGDLIGGDNADNHSSLSRSVHSKNHFVPSLRYICVQLNSAWQFVVVVAEVCTKWTIRPISTRIRLNISQMVRSST
jgi:hypothetical protein